MREWVQDTEVEKIPQKDKDIIKVQAYSCMSALACTKIPSFSDSHCGANADVAEANTIPVIPSFGDYCRRGFPREMGIAHAGQKRMLCCMPCKFIAPIMLEQELVTKMGGDYNSIIGVMETANSIFNKFVHETHTTEGDLYVGRVESI